MFCGSSPGRDPAFLGAARDLGRTLAERGIGVVYGGGSAGLMGALATAALEAGGDVTGVLPAGLFPDGVTASPLRDHHPGTFTLEEALDMHARKARFHQLADAYVVLPGGLGTLEELAEVATWAQLGIHRRPIVVVDVEGFWAPLRRLLHEAAAGGFLSDQSLGLVSWVDGVDGLFDALAAYQPPPPESRLSPNEL